MQYILSIITEAIQPITVLFVQCLIYAIGIIGFRLLMKIFTKLGINLDDEMINSVKNTITDVVKELNQTTVNKMKSQSPDGKLTDEQQVLIYTTAYNSIKNILTNKQTSAIINKYGNITDGLKTLIESTIIDLKK